MFLFLPDSPVTAPLLSQKHRRMAVERLRENQTGVENKHFKPYQVKEAFLDYKLYIFFFLGCVCNIPNGGISNFGTIIIQGFGFSTLVTTLMQVRDPAVSSYFSSSLLREQCILICNLYNRSHTACLLPCPFCSAFFLMIDSRIVAVFSSCCSWPLILPAHSGFVMSHRTRRSVV